VRLGQDRFSSQPPTHCAQSRTKKPTTTPLTTFEEEIRAKRADQDGRKGPSGKSRSRAGDPAIGKELKKVFKESLPSIATAEEDRALEKLTKKVAVKLVVKMKR
jgi:hypothetical protein